MSSAIAVDVDGRRLGFLSSTLGAFTAARRAAGILPLVLLLEGRRIIIVIIIIIGGRHGSGRLVVVEALIGLEVY